MSMVNQYTDKAIEALEKIIIEGASDETISIERLKRVF